MRGWTRTATTLSFPTLCAVAQCTPVLARCMFVLRFVPPLIISDEEIDRAVEAVARCVDALDET